MMNSFKPKRIYYLLASILLPLFLFTPSIFFGFLVWDDQATLFTNTRYRGFSWEHLQWMWTTHYMGPYQPISWMSYALNYLVFGTHPMGFHLTNIFFHALNGWLLFLVIEKLYPQFSPSSQKSSQNVWNLALIGSVFFSCHPLRVESVTWITERRDVLSGFFSLLSLYFFLEPTSKNNRLSIYSFLLGGLSKATAIGFFWIFAFIESRTTRNYKRLLPYILASGVIAALNMYGLHSGDLPRTEHSLVERLMITLHAGGFYWAKMLFPMNLSPYYFLPKDMIPTLSLWLTYGSISLLIALIAYRFQKKFPVIGVCFILFYLLVLPVSGLLQNGQQRAADRYTYLAGLPVAFLMSWMCGWAFRQSKRHIVRMLPIIYLCGLMVGTFLYQRFWKTDQTLWQRAVAVEPDNELAVSNLAQAYFRAGQFQQAEPFLIRSITLNPREWSAWLNLGYLREQEKRWKSARIFYEHLLTHNAGDSKAWLNWCGTWFREGNANRAIAELRKGLLTRPAFSEARFNLGVILLSQKRIVEAKKEFERLLETNPLLIRRLPPQLRKEIGLPTN